MRTGKIFPGKWVVLLLFPFALAAGCGGGGDTSGSPSGGAGTVSGAAAKGPVSGATITVYAIQQDGTRGGQIGSGQTDAQGNFSISMGSHSGPFMLQMSGGNYMDEATGSIMRMDPNDVMTCVISQMPAGSTVSGIQITPLTSMAQSMAQNMPGGMNQMNINRANSAFGNYFGVSDMTTTHPMDPTMNGSGASATQDMRNHGMAMAAMSQYAKNIGMPHSSGMVTAMMNDASDGRMDGMMTGQSGMMGSHQVEMGGA